MGAVKRNHKGREGNAKDAKNDDHFADAAMCTAADYLLFDSGAGSGKPFDWTLLNASLLTPLNPPPKTAASGSQKSANAAKQTNSSLLTPHSSLLTPHSSLLPPPSSLPWFLAGGISLENIGRALSLRPFGLDISSGAETDGFKDREKMIALVKRVREENL
jgi:phosphoribosylanthranilate isomerase